MTEPWSPERRDETKAQIDDLARFVEEQLDADAVVIIALYREGENGIHVQDGGQTPIPLPDLYRGLAQAHDMVAERGEGWVS
jgi:hypothetical protein